MGPIPPLGWPRVWVLLTGYALLSNVYEFTFHDGDAVMVFPIMAGIFWLALRWYRQRLKEREAWRDQRFRTWLRKPLNPPVVVDWEKFEVKVAKKVKREENPRRHRSLSRLLDDLNQLIG
jgi:hypothetical protein